MDNLRTLIYTTTIEVVVLFVLAWRWIGLTPTSAIVFASASVFAIVVLQIVVGFADAHFTNVEHERRRAEFEITLCKCGHRGSEHRVVHRVACDQCACSAMVEVIRSDEEDSDATPSS